jgi:hypothetical protein
VFKNRGHRCGDIQLEGYLANEAGPVSLVLDLRIAHDRMGSSAETSLNCHLKYPNNFDQSLNDAAADKIRKYRADYNNRPPSAVSFMPLLLLVRQAGYIVNLSEFYSYRLIGKLTAFLQLQEFSLRRHTQVASSPSAARLSSHSYRGK